MDLMAWAWALRWHVLCRFSASLDHRQRVTVAGTVKDNHPYLIRIGNFDVDLALEGTVLLCRQQDRPGIIAAVSSALAAYNVNISFMSVARLDTGRVRCFIPHLEASVNMSWHARELC